jgi:hypothetical protein
VTLYVRPTTYKRLEGWLVCGRDARDRRVSIFTRKRETAVAVRDALKADEPISDILISEVP